MPLMYKLPRVVGIPRVHAMLHSEAASSGIVENVKLYKLNYLPKMVSLTKACKEFGELGVYGEFGEY